MLFFFFKQKTASELRISDWSSRVLFRSPSCVLAYDTLSETNWLAPGVTPAFIPNMFVDISETIERKIAAFQAFRSQVKPSPDERSIEAIRPLATPRGAPVYRQAAEPLVWLRQID